MTRRPSRLSSLNPSALCVSDGIVRLVRWLLDDHRSILDTRRIAPCELLYPPTSSFREVMLARKMGACGVVLAKARECSHSSQTSASQRKKSRVMLLECLEAFRAKPTEKHLHAVKRIFRYLKGTINMGLWYSKDSCIALTAFAYADHVGCQDTRRSTSGSRQLFGDILVSWSSKK
ncbi:hypothetical protein Tco_0045091 [Tanacetum coccineum]